MSYSQYSSPPENRFAMQLNDTCWNGLVNGVINTYSFEYQPTFFHNGGVFKLKYLDQYYIVYANGKNYITLQATFGNQLYRAQYNGGNKLTWATRSGSSMTWELTVCDGTSTQAATVPYFSRSSPH